MSSARRALAAGRCWWLARRAGTVQQSARGACGRLARGRGGQKPRMAREGKFESTSGTEPLWRRPLSVPKTQIRTSNACEMTRPICWTGRATGASLSSDRSPRLKRNLAAKFPTSGNWEFFRRNSETKRLKVGNFENQAGGRWSLPPRNPADLFPSSCSTSQPRAAPASLRCGIHSIKTVRSQAQHGFMKRMALIRAPA